MQSLSACDPLAWVPAGPSQCSFVCRPCCQIRIRNHRLLASHGQASGLARRADGGGACVRWRGRDAGRLPVVALASGRPSWTVGVERRWKLGPRIRQTQRRSPRGRPSSGRRRLAAGRVAGTLGSAPRRLPSRLRARPETASPARVAVKTREARLGKRQMGSASIGSQQFV